MSPEDLEEALEEVRDLCLEKVRQEECGGWSSGLAEATGAQAEMARDILLIIGDE